MAKRAPPGSASVSAWRGSGRGGAQHRSRPPQGSCRPPRADGGGRPGRALPAGRGRGRERGAGGQLGTGAPKLLDASTAHRSEPDWAYGFAELAPGQARRIADATMSPIPAATRPARSRLLRPLVDAGLFPRDYPVTINAVSGYSGGGRAMIRRTRPAARPSTCTRWGSSTSTCPKSRDYAGLGRGGRSSCPRSCITARACWCRSRCISIRCRGGQSGRAARRARGRYEGAELVRVLPPAPAGSSSPRAERHRPHGAARVRQ